MQKHRAREQREAEAYVKKAGYARGGDVAEDKAMVKSGVGQHEGNMHRGKPKTPLKLATGGIVAGSEQPKRLDRRARGGGITPGMPGKSRGTNVNIMLHTADQEGRQKAAQQGMQQGAMMGAKAAMAKMGGAPGAPGAPSGAPTGPPPGAPPGGMMPPGGPPAMRPPGMKRGGRLVRKDVGGPITHPLMPQPVPQMGGAAGGMMPRGLNGAPPPGLARAAMMRPAMKRGGAVKMKAGAGSGEGRLDKIKAQHSGKQRVKSYERKARGGKV